MKNNSRILPKGKLRHQFLEKMLKNFVTDLDVQDKRVIISSMIGEDAAVIDMGDKYLVAKTDPITFATDVIGYYAVNVNVNDIVCMGAEPKWFQSTILLPEKNTTEELVENIFKNIHDTCKSMNILGEVEKEKLVATSGAKPGNALILTKGIFIEGTSIIGREKEEELKEKGQSDEFIQKCKNYLYEPGISVLKEALLANRQFKINSFHDVTEGGLACSIAEMSISSKTGVLIEKERVSVLPEPLILSKLYNLDPLNTISSGSLLIAVEENESNELVNLLKKNNISAEKIGNIVPKKDGLKIKENDGNISPLIYSETDEITKIF